MKLELALCSLIVGFFVGGFTHKYLSNQYAPLVVRVVIPAPQLGIICEKGPYGPCVVDYRFDGREGMSDKPKLIDTDSQIPCHMEPGMDLTKVYCDHGVSMDTETRKPWVAPKAKHKPESEPCWSIGRNGEAVPCGSDPGGYLIWLDRMKDVLGYLRRAHIEIPESFRPPSPSFTGDYACDIARNFEYFNGRHWTVVPNLSSFCDPN